MESSGYDFRQELTSSVIHAPKYEHEPQYIRHLHSPRGEETPDTIIIYRDSIVKMIIAHRAGISVVAGWAHLSDNISLRPSGEAKNCSS
jgi:hypothetical protein